MKNCFMQKIWITVCVRGGMEHVITCMPGFFFLALREEGGRWGGEIWDGNGLAGIYNLFKKDVLKINLTMIIHTVNTRHNNPSDIIEENETVGVSFLSIVAFGFSY